MSRFSLLSAVAGSIFAAAQPLTAQVALRPSGEFATLPQRHSYVIGLQVLHPNPESDPRLFLVTTQESYTSLMPYVAQQGWQKEFDFTPYNMNLFEDSLVQTKPGDPNTYFLTGGVSLNRSIRFQQSPIAVVSNTRIGNFSQLPNGFVLRDPASSGAPVNVFYSIDGQDGSTPGLYRHTDATTTWTALPANTFGTSGAGQVTSGVGALQFGPDGLLNVIDTGAQRIFRYNPDTLAYVSEVALGNTNTNRGPFIITPNGYIMTTFTDSAGGAIYDYTTGALLGTYGTYSAVDVGSAEGFGSKTSMTLDPTTGLVYVLHVTPDGREGLFTYDTSRLSNPVFTDPNRLTVSHEDLNNRFYYGNLVDHTREFTITGDNHYPNGVFFESGTLILGSAGALGSTGPINFSGGTMKFSADNTTDYSPRFSPDAGQQYSFDANDQNVTLATALTSDGGSLRVRGTTNSTGVLTLTGANSFTGGITLEGGNLGLGSAQAIGSTGTITFRGGTMKFSAANNTDYSARFSTADNQQFSFDTSGREVTLATALVSTSGSLSKTGAGTLTLAAANTYTGSTTVSGGTLSFSGGNDRLPASTNLFVFSGSGLDLAGTTQTVASLGSITQPVDGTLRNGTLNSPGDIFLHSGTYDAAFTGSGAGARTYIGSYTGANVLLSGANDRITTAGETQMVIGSTVFSGPYAVTGTNIIVKLGSPNALLASTETVELRGGTLDLNGQLNVRGQSIFITSIINDARLINGNPTQTASFNQSIELFTVTLKTEIGGPGNLTLGGGITGNGHLEKIGAGTLTLGGANAYSGTTSVTAGTLLVNGSLGTETVSVASGATLSGSGTINSTVNFQSGSRLSPGNSPGKLSVGDTTWNGGANYVWEINDASSPATSAGTRYDLLSISGTLTIAATSGNKFTLTLASLLANNSSGNALNFNASENYSYTIATATGGIFGFDANAFTIDASSFTNALAGGSWKLALGNTNRDLNLNFTAAAAAIPEPSTYAMIFGAGALALALLRQRHRRMVCARP